MAGSLNHIVGDNGRIRLDLLDGMSDAGQALRECYDLIYHLAGGDTRRISAACQALGFPDPWSDPQNLPMPMVPEHTAVGDVAPPEDVPDTEMSEGDYTTAVRDQLQTDKPLVREFPIIFCMSGLHEEAGEADWSKKLMREDFGEKACHKTIPGGLKEINGKLCRYSPSKGAKHDALVKELGDVMWYLYNLMDQIGVTPGEVRRLNYEKCRSRHQRGTVQGDGSDR